jgi:hypothetical protein
MPTLRLAAQLLLLGATVSAETPPSLYNYVSCISHSLMTTPSEESFLQQLERQASLQAQLERKRFFPRQLDPLTAIVGKNAWQVLAACSLLTALLLEVV